MAKVVRGEGLFELEAFYPSRLVPASLPQGVPEGVLRELREGELCAAGGAYRAGVAMLRSALEKLLAANGFTKKRDGNLKGSIDAAAVVGVITTSDARAAHEEVRDRANAIVHKDWRDVSAAEWAEALRYLVRIADCFYGHRETARALLVEKNRIPADDSAAGDDSVGEE
jgi:hypothetical protein